MPSKAVAPPPGPSPGAHAARTCARTPPAAAANGRIMGILPPSAGTQSPVVPLARPMARMLEQSSRARAGERHRSGCGMERRAAGSPPVSLDPLPARPRVEGGDAARDARGVRPQVALVNGAGMTREERLDARDAVLGRDSDDAEAADHPSVHDIAHGAARGGGTLGLEKPEEIAVERPRRVVRPPAPGIPAGSPGP